MTGNLIMPRRSFITGLAALVAAPAIVRASNLMPVKSMLTMEDLLHERMEAAYVATRESMSRNLYGELAAVTRKAFVPKLYVQLYKENQLLLKLKDHGEF